MYSRPLCQTLLKALLMSMNSATERSFDSFAACMLAVSIVSGCLVDLRFLNPNWYIGMQSPITYFLFNIFLFIFITYFLFNEIILYKLFVQGYCIYVDD